MDTWAVQEWMSPSVGVRHWTVGRNISMRCYEFLTNRDGGIIRFRTEGAANNACYLANRKAAVSITPIKRKPRRRKI